MGTQHVTAVGLTRAPTGGRWATDRHRGSRGDDRGRGSPDHARPSTPPCDAV